jgi:hypothetical protein
VAETSASLCRPPASADVSTSLGKAVDTVALLPLMTLSSIVSVPARAIRRRARGRGRG